MHNVVAYIIYLSCSLIIVLWVGKLLHRNGRLYLEETCPDKQLADSSNNLLYVGYCLVNTGFAFYQLNSLDTLNSFTEVTEFISRSEGSLALTLGIMHFINMLTVPKIIRFFSPTDPFNNNQPGTKSSGTKPTSL